MSLSDLIAAANELPAHARADVVQRIGEMMIEHGDELLSVLREVEETLRLVEHPECIDPVHGPKVEALGRHIGFGALMTSASASWRKVLKEKGHPLGGEFVAGPCYGSIVPLLAKVRAAINFATSSADRQSRPDGGPA
jgi:hypothetical protein